MKNNFYKVDYKKHFSKDGTVYNQTITISKELADRFNAFVDREKESRKEHFTYTDEDIKIFSFLEKLNTSEPTFSNLTTLAYFKIFYVCHYYTPPKKDKNVERTLYRNTIFKVIA